MNETTQATPEAPAGFPFVLVRPEALEAAAICASREASRPQLNGVFVVDGAPGRGPLVVATDGHRLIEVHGRGEDAMLEADYPQRGTPEGMHAPDAKLGVIIPTAAAKKAAAEAKRIKSRLPGLRTVAISVGPLTSRLTSTDLDTTNRTEFRPVDGMFPNWRQLMPQGEPVLRIGMNAETLAETLQAFVKAGGDDPAHQVTLSFYSELGAVLIESGDGRVRGLVMPLRLPADPTKA